MDKTAESHAQKSGLRFFAAVISAVIFTRYGNRKGRRLSTRPQLNDQRSDASCKRRYISVYLVAVRENGRHSR